MISEIELDDQYNVGLAAANAELAGDYEEAKKVYDKSLSLRNAVDRSKDDRHKLALAYHEGYSAGLGV